MIAIDLSKQQALDADPKAIQQLTLKEIQLKKEINIQQYFSLLKKQKKPFQIFRKEP